MYDAAADADADADTNKESQRVETQETNPANSRKDGGWVSDNAECTRWVALGVWGKNGFPEPKKALSDLSHTREAYTYEICRRTH